MTTTRKKEYGDYGEKKTMTTTTLILSPTFLASRFTTSKNEFCFHSLYFLD